MIEFRINRTDRLRLAARPAVLERLSRTLHGAGYSLDRRELDSLRPNGLAVAVATRRRRVLIRIQLGEHAAGLPDHDQHELAAMLCRRFVSETLDGFAHERPLASRRRNRTQTAWIEVWDKQRLVPTGLMIHACDDEDATDQLLALAEAIGAQADALTICPPPGWQSYGDSRMR